MDKPDQRQTYPLTAGYQPNPHASPHGTFYFIQVVLSVAFIVATLFTAWTPAGLLPNALAGKISQALSSISITPSPAFPTQTPRPQPRIGVVSGHWGNDSGAVCSDNLTEADVNLGIASKVKEILATQGYVVDILKEFDPKLQGYQALALISIHADSCDYINDLATGFKVAAAQANPHPDRTTRLVACLTDRYQRDTGLQIHDSITPDMSSYHAFDEISVDTTAAIIEVGFLNLDRQILTQGQDSIAKGITDGILCFLNNESVSSQVVP